jgi:hypothetical protein
MTLYQGHYSLRVGMFALPTSNITFLLQIYQHVNRFSDIYQHVEMGCLCFSDIYQNVI